MRINETQLLDRSIERPSFKKVFLAPIGKTSIFFGERRMKLLAIWYAILTILLFVPIFIVSSIFLHHAVGFLTDQTQRILTIIVLSLMICHSLYRLVVSTSFIWSKNIKIPLQTINAENIVIDMIIEISYIVVMGIQILSFVELDSLIPITQDEAALHETFEILGIIIISIGSCLLFFQLATIFVTHNLKLKIIDEQLNHLSKKALTAIDSSIPVDLSQDVVDKLLLSRIT